MKTIIFTLTFVFFTTVSFAQNQTKQNSAVQQKLISENTTYQLIPTKNYWTFIKLDTRNGRMWQVHFSIKEENARGILELSTIPLVNQENEKVGRFALYPTENIYNFLLVDQIDGKVYQVQWSMDVKNRGVIPIE